MKKKLLTAAALMLAAVVLVVSTVVVTVAYLTASSSVSNVFTVGNVEIEMFETKVNPDGTAVDPKQEVDANTYHLTPASTYVKDPTIRIISKLDNDQMYLFVKSHNQIRRAEAGNNGGIEPTMREQMKANGWVEYVMSGDGVEIVWVYGTRGTDGVITPTAVYPTYKQTRKDVKPVEQLTAGNVFGDPYTVGEDYAGEIRLCQQFTIHKDSDVRPYGVATVTFSAFAIQSSGISGGTDGWESIKGAFPFDCSIVNPVNPYDRYNADPYKPIPDSQINTTPAPTPEP